MEPKTYCYSNIGKRSVNEDSVAADKYNGGQGVYAILGDGLGGHGGGDVASQTAVSTLINYVACGELPSQETVMQWLLDTNERIRQKSDGPNRMKTTIVLLSIVGNQAIWAHIGDSRLYHFYNGNMVEVTQDHSVTQMAVNAGEITRDQMPHHPDRCKLLRSMGGPDIQPTIHEPIILEPGRHSFLLCSDGFWEFVTEGEMTEFLRNSATPKQWVDQMRAQGDERRKLTDDVDNNTAAAVTIDIGGQTVPISPITSPAGGEMQRSRRKKSPVFRWIGILLALILVAAAMFTVGWKMAKRSDEEAEPEATSQAADANEAEEIEPKEVIPASEAPAESSESTEESAEATEESSVPAEDNTEPAKEATKPSKSEDPSTREVECDCGEVITFSEKDLENGSVRCPGCGETVDLSADGESENGAENLEEENTKLI